MRLLRLIIAFLVSEALPAQERPLRLGITDTFRAPLACAMFKDADLQPGEPLLFIGFDPQYGARGQIVQKRMSICREDSILEGTAYDVQFEDAEVLIPGLGLSVIGSDLEVVSEGTQLEVILPSSEKRLTFKRCASSEGLHFFAYQDSVEFWHEYYHLPYDTLRACLDSDFENGQR